jgi:hypothetical protein
MGIFRGPAKEMCNFRSTSAIAQKKSRLKQAAQSQQGGVKTERLISHSQSRGLDEPSFAILG